MAVWCRTKTTYKLNKLEKSSKIRTWQLGVMQGRIIWRLTQAQWAVQTHSRRPEHINIWETKVLSLKNRSKKVLCFSELGLSQRTDVAPDDATLDEFISYEQSEIRILVCEFVTACLLSMLATYLLVLYAKFVLSYQPIPIIDFNAEEGTIKKLYLPISRY